MRLHRIMCIVRRDGALRWSEPVETICNSEACANGESLRKFPTGTRRVPSRQTEAQSALKD